MTDAVESAKVPNMVWYNYRRVPAVTLLKNLLDEGRFGRIFHYRAKFLQDWTISQDLPQGGEGLWRLDVAVAGSGVTFGAVNIARDFSVPPSGIQGTLDAHSVSDKPFMSKVIRSALWNFGPD